MPKRFTRRFTLMGVALVATLALGYSSVAAAAPYPESVRPAEPSGEQQEPSWPEWSDSLNDGEPFGDALQALGAEYPSVFNDTRIDLDNGLLEVRYNRSGDREVVNGFLEAAQALPAVPGMSVVLIERDFSLAQSQAVVNRIFEDYERWQKEIGGEIWEVYADQETGMIHMAVDPEIVDGVRAAVKDIDGVPVEISAYLGSGNPEVGPQLSRFSDDTP